MGPDDQYCLRWNDFETNIKNALYDLNEEKDFADVTLICGDGKVDAHKVILSTGSTFFQKILKENPHSKPLIYLKGVKFSELNSVLGFVYHGEASIATANLSSFLALAEELEVKGLRDKDKDQCDNGGSQTFHPLAPSSAATQHLDQSNQQSPSPASSAMFNNNRENLMKAEPKSEPPEVSGGMNNELQERDASQFEVDGYNQYDDYDQYEGYNPEESYNQDTELEKQGSTSGEKYCGRTDLDQYVVHVSGNTRKGEFKCKLCGKISTSKQASFNHVENQHFPGRYEYNCGRCNKKFDTYTKLADHRSSRRKHCTPAS